MRIGIDIRNIGKKRTGDEVVFFNLVKNLALFDTENDYFLFTDITDKETLEEIRVGLGIETKYNFKVISLKARNRFSWNLFAIAKNLRKNQVDVYHTQYILPLFVPKKIKLVTTIHDVSFNAYPEYIKFSDRFFLKILVPRSLKKAAKIIAVSEFTKNEIIKYYQIDPEKIDVIQNSVGENFLKNLNLSESPFALDIQKKYSLPINFILYLGTLQPRKNLPLLIEAYAKIKDEINDTKLVICGNRDAHNFDRNIDKKINELSLKDSVFFPGFIEEKDKPAIFKLAKIFCYPSFYEGFGIPILEAFASSVPVIASNILPHQEISGDSALLFNPTDPTDLSSKIKEVILNNDFREKLIEKGRQRISNFSWSRNAKEILEIYQKLASK